MPSHNRSALRMAPPKRAKWKLMSWLGENLYKSTKVFKFHKLKWAKLRDNEKADIVRWQTWRKQKRDEAKRSMAAQAAANAGESS